MRSLEEQLAIILKRSKQFQVVGGGNSENEEDNQNNTALRNEMDDINAASLIKNIFDFLALDFIEL